MEDVLQVPVPRGYLTKLCTGLIANSLDDSDQEMKDAIPPGRNSSTAMRGVPEVLHRSEAQQTACSITHERLMP